MKVLFKCRYSYQFAYSLILLLLTTNLLAQRRGYELSKKKNEQYTVSSTEKLEVENRFGQVKINTWNKNQLTVDITIIAWGRNEQVAQDLLDKINIDHRRRDGEISFKTNISKTSNNNNKSGFEINYEINMPQSMALDLDNRFGAIYLGNHSGTLELVSAYGSLTAKRLMGKGSEIKISYGKATIEEISSGSLKSSYCGYVEITKAGTLIIDDRNGKVEIDEADELEVESAYSHFRLRQLNHRIELESKFGGVDIEDVKSGFSRIDIEISYGSLSLDLDNTPDFVFDVDVSFGSFNTNVSGVEIKKQIEGYTSAEYSGFRGKGGNSFVSVESSYGSVKFN